MKGMKAGHSDIDVSIVIVNYRVKYFLEQTVRSAKEALAGFSGEIIVVDNNSGDDSIEHLRKCFPDVIVIENRENAGFGRANNQGFAIARGKFTLILNPDTIIGSHTLRDCMDFYDKHADDCGGIGVCMLDGNGRFLPESKRAFPTPWVSFCKIFGLSSLFPKSPLFAKYHLRYLPYDRPHRVDILSGAFIFIRTDLLRSIGGFDEDFFMYGEDIDLSYRIVKAGYSNYYIPSPIIHYKGESTQKNSYRYVKVFYEAMQIFFRKHYPHYSLVYGAVIRFAISLRSWMGLAHRFVDRLLPKKQPEVEYYDYVEAVTDEYLEIRNALKVPYDEYCIVRDLSTHRFFSSRVFVVFDNRKCSYSETIKAIYRFSRRNMDFATYLSESKVIITPKM